MVYFLEYLDVRWHDSTTLNLWKFPWTLFLPTPGSLPELPLDSNLVYCALMIKQSTKWCLQNQKCWVPVTLMALLYSTRVLRGDRYSRVFLVSESIIWFCCCGLVIVIDLEKGSKYMPATFVWGSTHTALQCVFRKTLHLRGKDAVVRCRQSDTTAAPLI